MAEDPPVSTTAGAAVSTAVTTGGVVANTQSNTVAPTSLTAAVGGGPMVSTQIQMQALQVALQAAQNAIGGLLNTSVPGPFNLASMFNSLPGSTLPPAGMDVDSLAQQNQMQVLQVALQAVQIAIGGLLNIGVPQDVRQIPFFSPEMAVLGPFNLASMFQALLGSVLPPADVDSLAIVVSRMALEHYTFLENKDMNKKKGPKFEREVGQPGFTGCHRCGGNHWVKNCPVLK